MGWFTRRKAPTEILVEQIIQEGIERRKLDHEVASKTREFELRKLEIEMEHIEAIGEERRRDRADKAAARKVRQEWAARARDIKEQQKNGAQVGEKCPVCANPSDPNLTIPQLEWHVNGHRQGPSLWAQ